MQKFRALGLSADGEEIRFEDVWLELHPNLYYVAFLLFLSGGTTIPSAPEPLVCAARTGG